MVHKSEAIIERIRDLEGQRSGARINSSRHRQLMKAIHVQASLYRQSLDHEQAAEQFDPKPVLPPFDPAARPRDRPNNRLLAYSRRVTSTGGSISARPIPRTNWRCRSPS